MSIKAIETSYKNCKFRSRLEARYAVFFEELGVEWVYEKEGFELNGVYYLPDFWLPESKTWVEIKPTPPGQEAMLKAKMLSEQSGNDVVILYGDNLEPRCFKAIVFPEKRTAGKHDQPAEHALRFIKYLFYRQLRKSALILADHISELSAYPEIGQGDLEKCQVYLQGTKQTPIEALIKAKQARFEFSRNGKN